MGCPSIRSASAFLIVSSDVIPIRCQRSVFPDRKSPGLKTDLNRLNRLKSGFTEDRKAPGLKTDTENTVSDSELVLVYSAGREAERQRFTNSSVTAVPAHITVSAPPQYIFTVPSSSGTAPQVKTTFGT